MGSTAIAGVSPWELLLLLLLFAAAFSCHGGGGRREKENAITFNSFALVDSKTYRQYVGSKRRNTPHFLPLSASRFSLFSILVGVTVKLAVPHCILSI